MQFVFLENLGITTHLRALEKRSNPYNVLLYQHEGHLKADNSFIGNRDNVDSRLHAIFEKAIQTNTDFFLAPEYCCSWRVIVANLSDKNKWPAREKLWAIGCESITPEEILAFQQETESDEIHIHFEQEIFNQGKSYVDPLVYLFRGVHDGRQKLIVLIQFKTAHMGPRAVPVERDNLIEGNSVYILRNGQTSVHFISLICSEAMNFPHTLDANTRTNILWEDATYLIFNPQMNPEPTHSEFCHFRKIVLESQRKEIITLNWHKDSTISKNNPLLAHKSSRSSIVLKSIDFEGIYRRIKSNHKKGVYYFFQKIDKHLYILNGQPHCFHFQITPVHITENLGVQHLRDGPNNFQTFFFNTANQLIEDDERISDYHLDYLEQTGCTSLFLTNKDTCILQKEIIVALSTGTAKKSHSGNWYEADNLTPFLAPIESDANNRLTFTEDRDRPNELVRENYIATLQELDNILSDASLFPPSIAYLQGKKLRIGYGENASGDNYMFNVVDESGTRVPITVCYVGQASEKIINQAFLLTQDLFDKTNKCREQVVVFYKRGNDIIPKYDQYAGKIGEVQTYDATSVLKSH
ncbi:hypothetical protein SIO70_00285 [Chitinophaga sancti]|uniref:hypothetical protein n=1 Tax=Chitinophaga sancti TaxID=1004 RepID=UPI002A74B965|nr:hypothetical protein [Chitinophaga sancti]WPQ63300.1 hypothetical protein SIO70_00285 [Chitinophaga sancti]